MTEEELVAAMWNSPNPEESPIGICGCCGNETRTSFEVNGIHIFMCDERLHEWAMNFNEAMERDGQ